MSATARGPRGRRIAAVALALASALALAVVLLRTFVGGVYRVDSGSMEPYLRGDAARGEHVLVLYQDRPELERFDAVVLLRPGEEDPVVKRVGGLPGETLQIVAGDLLIGGRRLDPSVPRPEPIAVYQQRCEPLAQAFQLVGGAWREGPEGWGIAARGLAPSVETSAVWPRKLLDGKVRSDCEVMAGEREVGDALLELELRVDGPGGRLWVHLSEEGDRFDLTLEPLAGGRARAVLARHATSAEPRQLAEGELALPPGTWHRLRFANLDNALILDVDGERAVLSASYEANTALTGLPDATYRHLAPRVVFGAAGLDLDVRDVRVLRDVSYTARGVLGVRQPLTLGPDELFVLGDNSAESLDSRDFGPVWLDQVLGIPVAVVWPPSGWRLLRGPGGGP